MPRITTVNSVNDTSTVNLTCIATGDERTSLHWQIDGYDATNKADGQTYEKVLATTVLRLNLSSLTSPLSCEWIEGPRQKCVNAVTCLARSSGMTWDDKDYIIEQIIGEITGPYRTLMCDSFPMHLFIHPTIHACMHPPSFHSWSINWTLGSLAALFSGVQWTVQGNMTSGRADNVQSCLVTDHL